jgi:hypothetical protein
MAKNLKDSSFHFIACRMTWNETHDSYVCKKNRH